MACRMPEIEIRTGRISVVVHRIYGDADLTKEMIYHARLEFFEY
jgi:hypothetical protein